MLSEPEVVGSNPTGATRNRSAVAQWQSAVTTLIHNFVGHLIRKHPDCRFWKHAPIRTRYTLDCPFGVHGKRPIGLAGSSPAPSACKIVCTDGFSEQCFVECQYTDPTAGAEYIHHHPMPGKRELSSVVSDAATLPTLRRIIFLRGGHDGQQDFVFQHQEQAAPHGHVNEAGGRAYKFTPEACAGPDGGHRLLQRRLLRERRRASWTRCAS
jgi:hypothetical protein